MAQRQVADSLGAKFFFNTYGASSMACAAGRAVLDRLYQRHEVVGDVRGRGLMQAIELVADRKTKAPATQAAAEIFERTREHGLVVSKSGANKNVLRMVPPTCLQLGDLQAAADALERCFQGY